MVRPHGAEALVPLLLEGAALEAERRRADTLPRWRVSSRERGDILMLGLGGFTPLTGFMGEADWRGACDDMKLASANGLFWPIPITLSVDEAFAARVGGGTDIALADPDDGHVLATMTVTERYTIDKAHECVRVFRTTDAAHPGVKMVMEQPPVNLAGPVKVLSQGGFPQAYGDLYMTPAQTRKLFESRGWSRVAAFQTRNPMHPLARDAPGQGRRRGLRRRARALAARGAEARRHPGRCAHARHRGAGQELLDAVDHRCRPATRSTCARRPARKRSCTRSSYRQNYGCSHLIVSGATAPASAATTARSMRTASSTRSPTARFRSSRCASARLFLVATAAWRHGQRPHCPHGDADRLQIAGLTC
ncbi:MAG: hypothetical protein U1F67_15940 [Rubrivivax sp.]